MAEVDRLLRDYIARFESGGFADPREFLSKLEDRDRSELAALIDGYLEHAAPPKDWDPEAFEGSLAQRAVAQLAEQWSGGDLPRELVALRTERKLKRSELIAKLAEALGVTAKQEKVALYYHRMEHGLLPAEGISGRVFDALATLLGTSAEALRRAASPSGASEDAATFARLARPDATKLETFDALEGAPSPERESEDWDEVDRLFLGG
jgi:hypothetical protein